MKPAMRSGLSCFNLGDRATASALQPAAQPCPTLSQQGRLRAGRPVALPSMADVAGQLWADGGPKIEPEKEKTPSK